MTGFPSFPNELSICGKKTFYLHRYFISKTKFLGNTVDIYPLGW
jgi:hypothetical protein